MIPRVGFLLLIGACSLGISAGMSRVAAPEVSHVREAVDADTPWAFVFVERSSGKEWQQYIDIAVWDDGYYLYRQPVRDKPEGKAEYVIGKLKDEQLSQLKSGMEKEALTALKWRTFSVPDSSYTELALRDASGELQPSRWDERVVRNWGANSAASSDYLDFARKWTAVRILLVSKTPESDRELMKSLEAGQTFRGFGVNLSPSEIPWVVEMRKRDAQKAKGKPNPGRK